MTLISTALIGLALVLCPSLLLVGASILARRYWHRKDRRNPLTRGLLRSPGYSLQERLDDVRTDLISLAGGMAPIPMFVYYMTSTTAMTEVAVYLLWFFVVGILLWAVFRVFALVRQARNLRLGMEAEMAAGQELSMLMRDGFFVFHDLPGDKKFNIDHVVVGPSGLFAVETKGRPKRVRDDGSGYRVTLQDGRLVFPGWSETAPLEQARLNASWLSKWLTSAVGEQVIAKPVLVLPGWFVERKSPSDVAVINGSNARQYFLKAQGSGISEQLVSRIVHQLDARCRDIQGRAYVHEEADAAS